MNHLESLKAKLEYISPQKVASYLQKTGWKLIKSVAGYVAFWEFQDRAGILLPLDRNLSDFEDRLLEIVLKLEEVEGRPSSEVVKALESTNRIAARQKREILDIYIKPISQRDNEIAIKGIGRMFGSLQNLLEILGKTLTDDRQELEVYLLETFPGSLGLRLAFSVERSTSATEEVAQKFIDLVSSKNSGESEAIAEELSHLHGDVFLRFKSLLLNLRELNADLFFDWGSINPDKDGVAQIDCSSIVRILEVIDKREVEQPVTEKAIGQLALFEIRARRVGTRIISFVIRGRGGSFISQHLMYRKGDKIELNQLYNATFSKTISLDRATGEERTEYVLIDLEQVSWKVKRASPM